MAQASTHVSGLIDADPDRVFAIAGDFLASFHPLIATMREDRDGRGAVIRAFTVKGEDTLYREQLVYRSISDRVIAYTHLEGIAGASRYDARLTVTPQDGASRIDWTAEIEAPDGRAQEIAEGTRFVFETGIAGLREALDRPAQGASGASASAGEGGFETLVIPGPARLALSVTGETDEPVILFLHGIGGNRRNWDKQLQALAPFARVAALDLRGYGDSTLGPAQTRIADHIDDILSAIDALGAERIVLCGLSFGAWIATSFAQKHPDKLAGLVLIGGCTGMSEAGQTEREAFRQSREVPLAEGKTPADFAPAVVNVLAGPDATEAVRAELFQSMAAIPTATYRDALVCFTEPEGRFDFSRLPMPVLMMTGEFDRLAPPDEIRGVANRIATLTPRASVRFEMIGRAGHVANLEAPAEVNRHLIDFVLEIAP